MYFLVNKSQQNHSQNIVFALKHHYKITRKNLSRTYKAKSEKVTHLLPTSPLANLISPPAPEVIWWSRDMICMKINQDGKDPDDQNLKEREKR